MIIGSTIKSKVRNVTGTTEKQKQSIIDFLQGAVYSWCKNRKGEWFSMRDLMGGDNFYSDGTPLLVLYTKHEDKGKDGEAALKDAGKDSGWLLKKMIADDERKFDTKVEEQIRKYCWKEN